ncbi:2-succinyl-5-enolpyruvyl-6-hydroxy-3-cyclohexene-1-carboxylic-acid synthase [Agrococcus carbonis]|uniref:2-succinyl-5-enolpyruvyl-6-hydroxy-3-cyclohexene-1-carboxylate synthase n=1 Tax=Agrococcus carbonis TaxID=684552 RepID=A0A1H1MR06_9MICO|nr:2-succinyl-5-enolpyruvyl-6-hydroxy-3-cyclohexene-1-carboxylic-acid synthase [Agrococcus carbonis]SDR89231.1 2-succinyl-5-enolpyruvyl-6-hydroxy-3-cyclohexene-1-carboxylate synthase [Agrococcus carbonis]
MPEPALPAAAYADRLVGALAAAGVTDLVVCPGSRSQAIALAAARAARDGRLALHVRIDERSAGFLALGLARETGSPAAIVVTSGTALANLHPAMLEAHHADVPLIAVTADRPAELQGIRANQTAHQPGIFGDAGRVVIDVGADALRHPEQDAVAAVRAALGWRGDDASGHHTEPGPVQLNIGFREPLSGGAPAEPLPVERVGRPPVPTASLGAAPATVVIAGADAGRAAAGLAEAIGAPLIAEPTSGARFGPAFVPHGRDVLARLGERVRRAVVVGHPTLSRAVTALIRRPDVHVVVLGRAGQDNVRGAGETTLLTGRIEVEPAEADAEGIGAAWIDEWVVAGRALAAERDAEAAPDSDLSRAAYARAELAEGRTPITRRELVSQVWDRTWPHDRLVVAASRLIRELDAWAGPKAVTARANRGLAGIDGTVSTASGIAIAHDRSGVGGFTRLLIGDLALLHDAGGLHVPPGEERPRLQIVVGNDFGGSLFDLLEVAGTADADDFARVQRTPHDVDLAHLAAAYGWPFERVTDRAGLRRALSQSRPGIIEAVLEEETDAQQL